MNTGTFGAPPDTAAAAALGLAVLSLGVASSSRLRDVVLRRPRTTVALLAAAAAALSFGYVHHYLRGGPRIIDATSYYLEGRALAGGQLSFEVPEPSGSFRGRFLLADEAGRSLSVLFPPGYPFVLALGFLAGMPMAVGPCIGAALVWVTYALARRLFEDARIALLAAALSVVSATLRYHTADTMSHGFSALLSSGAVLACASGGRVQTGLGGLSWGLLAATRPITALAVLAPILYARGRRLLYAPAFALGAVPGLALLLLYQKAATGHFFESTQLAYYAVADGPPGCFRYGFGSGIGCRVEHGDFVRAHLEGGYGLTAALGTTGRRLKMHLADAANLELFAGLLLWAVWVGRREHSVRLLGLSILALVVAYAPFYFDGNYPGGGARFYADALPFEHILLAYGATRLRLNRVAPAVALAGFSFHTAFEHGALRDREGGRPMFEASVLARSGVHRGLVFVETDHGFNLGHDPKASVHDGIVVARARDDAHDAWLHEALARPPTYRYRFRTGAQGEGAELVAFEPSASRRVEMEAELPPLKLEGGWLRPAYAPCASRGRGVKLESSGRRARVSVQVLCRRGGAHTVAVGFLGPSPEGAALIVGNKRLSLTVQNNSYTKPPCSAARTAAVGLTSGPRVVTLELPMGSSPVDYLEVEPLSPGAAAESQQVGPGEAGK